MTTTTTPAERIRALATAARAMAAQSEKDLRDLSYRAPELWSMGSYQRWTRAMAIRESSVAQFAAAVIALSEAVDVERVLAKIGVSEHQAIEERLTEALARAARALEGAADDDR